MSPIDARLSDEPARPSAPHDHLTVRRRRAALWSGVTVLLVGAWAAGLPHPFDGPPTMRLFSVLAGFEPRMGGGLVLCIGVAGLALAAIPRSWSRQHAPVRSSLAAIWIMTGVVGLVLVDGRLLALLGYIPVVATLGWSQTELVPAFLVAVTEPHVLVAVHAVIGLHVWGMYALAVTRRARCACEDCGRSSDWSPDDDTKVRQRALRTGRVAVAVAVVAALAYPAVRLPWAIGVPMGIDAEGWAELQATPGMASAGILLGLAALLGAALMVGLVADWGVRLPRWWLRLRGRRVPITAAVVPAAVVALALVAFGRGLLVMLLTGDFDTPVGAAWIQTAALVALFPWGLALAGATAAYAVRRRGPCRSCERGELEVAPSALRRG